MALIFLLVMLTSCVRSSWAVEEMALANVTRLATGDLFSLFGSDCGPTRCMEISHGTAMSAMGGDSSTCICRCRRETPAFREDQRVCVNHIDECLMASFGRGATKPQIPFVFLPLKGQIVYPAKEIIFTDVEDAICAVTSAQYLSPSGWMTLRDVVDNDVPFSLYRDEGSTFLQWRGSATLHTRLEGRMVAAHVLCSDAKSTYIASSCAAFRVAGASQNDVRSIPFHAGEIVTSESAQNQGLSVLEALAIGVCVLLLIFVYAAGIIFYVHYKQRQRRKQKDPEQTLSGTLSDGGSSLESRIDMSNVTLKTNPLLKFNGQGGDFFINDTGMSDHSERSEDTQKSSPNNSQKFQKLNSSVISAMVHTHRKKPTRPSIRSVSNIERFTDRLPKRSASPDTLERAPHSDLSIVDCSVDSSLTSNRHLTTSDGEPVLRKKLYFNPVFFETEHLKNPPPAAVEFLSKIREVMTIAKDKMTAKRFIPLLSDIPEEDLYQSIDLGWDIRCARRGRRFSAISLKQENTRRQVLCSGCPGCDNNARPQKAVPLTRSNSCKTCVSDDYKQRIVRKWLDEVPTPLSASPTKNSKSFNANGTPRITELKSKNEKQTKLDDIKQENIKPKITAAILKDNLKDFATENNRKDNKDRCGKEKVKKYSKEITPATSDNETQVSKAKDESKLAKIKEELRQFKQKQDLKALILFKEDGKKSLFTLNDSEVTIEEEIVKQLKVNDEKKSVKLIEEDNKVAKVLQESIHPVKISNDDVKFSKNKEQLKIPKSHEDMKLSKEEFKANIKIIRSNESIPKEENKLTISLPKSISPIIAREKAIPSSQTSHRIRKKLPPPPPPPMKPPEPPVTENNIKKDDEEPIPPEIKVRMEAVIRELNICQRAEPHELEEMKLETISPIAPKIVIPVIAADSHYFSDDNMITDFKKKEFYVNKENFVDYDSLERTALKKRRFSLACSPELQNKKEFDQSSKLLGYIRERFSSNSRDVTKSDDEYYRIPPTTILESRRPSVSEVFIKTPESLYNNISEPGPLTIQVRGSPVENRRRFNEDFDPDTLDRRPKRDTKKRVEKILLKSAGSFKYKLTPIDSEHYKKSPEIITTKKIGNLRQIYEAKARAMEEEAAAKYYTRRASITYNSQDMSAFVRAVKHPDLLRHIDNYKGPKPPVPPKARRDNDLSPKFTGTRESPPSDRRRMSEERDRFPIYTRMENLNARRSGRRSARTRSRRTDMRKLHRTEDSGYMSTDSNESKRRASYLMQLRPRNMFPELFPLPAARTVTKPQILQVESDTDELESLCDGRSESGGESVETDSVFFSNYEESKEIFAELGLSTFDPQCKMMHSHEQIDSGFMGETNIILSGDSDSEHRSVISIITGQDGRASSASISNLEEPPYMHTIEC